jgi:hypothetical protein
MRAGGVAQVVEYLPSKRKALTSNLTTAKTGEKCLDHLLCIVTQKVTIYLQKKKKSNCLGLEG